MIWCMVTRGLLVVFLGDKEGLYVGSVCGDGLCKHVT